MEQSTNDECDMDSSDAHRSITGIDKVAVADGNLLAIYDEIGVLVSLALGLARNSDLLF